MLTQLSGNAIYMGAIAEGQRPAKRVGGQFVGHRARKLILPVSQQIFLEPSHAAQLVFVEQLAGGIDRLLTDRIAPLADSIKMLERDPPRVNLGVARVTGR